MTIITRDGVDDVVNVTTALSQMAPVTLALSNGRYVVAWTDHADMMVSGPGAYANADIRAQIFNADGTRFGGEFIVTNAPGAQVLTSATQLSDGNILFAWQDGLGAAVTSGQAASVYFREFTINGGAATGALRVNVAGVDSLNPNVTALENGGHVMSWVSNGAIQAQIFTAGNARVGGQITVPAGPLGSVNQPEIVTLADGSFVVGWVDAAHVPQMQRYTATGLPVGTVNPLYYTGTAESLDMLVRPDGTIIAAVAEVNNFFGVTFLHLYELHADNSGINIYRSLQFANATADRFSLSNMADGAFAVTWSDKSPGAPYGDGSGSSIRGTIFSEDFKPVIANIPGVWEDYIYTFTINSDIIGDQLAPSIATLGNGNLVVSWADAGTGDGDQSGIRNQILHVDPANRAPVAFDAEFPDRLPTPDGQYAIDVFDLEEFAMDPDGDPVTLLTVGNAQNGTVELVGSQVVFTPAPGYVGPAVFDFTIRDSHSATSTAQATLLPSADDVVHVRGLTGFFIDLGLNDYLPPNVPYTISVRNIDGTPAAGIIPVSGTTQVRIEPGNAPLNYAALPEGQSYTQWAQYMVTDTRTGEIVRTAYVSVVYEGWARFGTSGTDSMTGTELADHLNGMGGADILTGLGGDDLYTIYSADAVIIEAAGGGIDTVLTTLANYVLPDNVENMRFFGSAAQTGGIAYGNALNNALTGGSGNDMLYGGAGNDSLTGGPGSDILVGGAGDDIYVVTDAGDIVTEAAGEGIDRVHTIVSYTLTSNVENGMILTNGAVNLTGNELDNILSGGSGANILSGLDGNDQISGGGGNDTLYGGSGNDILNGGAGADIMDGGAGDDILTVDNIGDVAIGGTGRDQIISYIDYVLASDVEDLTLAGTVAISGTGNAFANRITGNSADNILSGGAGNDILDGGAGADQMSGGDGNDIIIVDNIGDIVDGGAGRDRVDASISYTLGATVEDLTLTGAEALTGTGNALANHINGNSGANILYGGDGGDVLVGGDGADTLYGETGYDSLDGGNGNDILDGGTGADRMTGGAGNDIYYVDTHADTIIELAGGGLDTVYVNSATPGGGIYLAANVENAILQGTTRFVYGNELNNQIAGNGNANQLYGGAGNDILNGGYGNDRLEGGSGDDRLYGGYDADIFVFSSGGGADIVHDFQRGVDKLDLSAFGLGFAQLQSLLVQQGANSVLHLPTGETVTLANIQSGQLTAGDFIL